MSVEYVLRELDIDDIHPNPNNPREEFLLDEMREMAESIKEHGVLQPIGVLPTEGKFEVIFGGRRLQACRLAKARKVKALIFERATPQEASILSMVENIHRKDLNAFERSRAWDRMMKDLGIGIRDLSRLTGKSEGAINKDLEYLEVSKPIQKMVAKEEIEPRQAPILSKIEDKGLQKDVAQLAKDMTVRETQRVVQVLRKAEPRRQAVIVEELKKDQEAIKKHKEAVVEEAERYGRGQQIPGGVKIDKGPDLRRLQKFKDVWEEMRFLTVVEVEMIEDTKLRMEAVRYLQRAAQSLEGLLMTIQKRGWYGGG